MASAERGIAEPDEPVVRWLRDSDPSIRWQVGRDLLGEPEEVVAAERSRVALEGWGARLLSLQEPDGNWGGGPWVSRSWASTLETLMLLRELGLDPASPQAREAIGRVRDGSDWGLCHGHSPFFEGESEPCINGRVLACGAYFGEASDRLVARLLLIGCCGGAETRAQCRTRWQEPASEPGTSSRPVVHSGRWDDAYALQRSSNPRYA